MCKSKSEIVSRESLQKAIIRAVESDDVVGLEDICDYFLKHSSTTYVMPVLTIDDPVLTAQGIELNALAYAFRLGRVDIARFLLEKANSSLSRLYSIYKSVGKTPLHVLCEYGHTDLLQYFLPKHIENQYPRNSPLASFHESYEELSIFADTAHRHTISLSGPNQSQTPVQRACERGFIDILRTLNSFSTEHGSFKDIDLHAEDEKSGENCALISCRTGNLPMMQFLYEECRADFTILNKRKESALQLALLGAKRHQSTRYLECIHYLLETVKIDVLYEYEETLLLIEDKSTQDYIEKRLRVSGVVVTKKMVDEEFSIKKNRSVRPETEAKGEMERRLKDVGTHFQISELFREEFEAKSYLSSITPASDMSRDFASPTTPVFKEIFDLSSS